MKKYALIFLVMLLLAPFFMNAQEKKEEEKNPVTIKFSGYINYDMFYDTRQSVDSREGEMYYYPLNKEFDKKGSDINDKSQFEMASMRTRLGVKLSGPDAFGAKTSGYFEADFLGMSNQNLYHFRLRHAFIKFNWNSTELLLGQSWHPMSVINCTANTVQEGNGRLFNPFNRSPQIRLTQSVGDYLKFVGALLVNNYAKSEGPANAHRDAAIPDMEFQMQIGDPKFIYGGFNFGYKWLMPRLVTDSAFKTNRTVGSYNASAFLRLNLPIIDIKFMGIYGQNLSNLSMIGGYGQKYSKFYPQTTDDFYYTNLITNSLWTDWETKGEKLQVGFFAGYTSIVGSESELQMVDDSPVLLYAKGGDLDYVYRISPRIKFISGNVTLGLEWSKTTAAYATKYGKNFEPAKSETVANNRYIFSARYTF